jgi:hypothetical protein
VTDGALGGDVAVNAAAGGGGELLLCFEGVDEQPLRAATSSMQRTHNTQVAGQGTWRGRSSGMVAG